MKKGKFNIIDVIVIAIVVIIIGSVGYRIYSSRTNAGGNTLLDEKQYIYAELYANQVVPEAIDTLKAEMAAGDRLVANGKQTNGEIVYIEDEPSAYIGMDEAGNTILTQHPLWRDLHVIIRDKVNPGDVTLKAGEQEVRVNYTYILKTQQFEGNTKVRSIKFVPVEEAEAYTEADVKGMFGDMRIFQESAETASSE